MSNQQKLLNITAPFYTETIDYKALSEAIQNYKQLLLQLSELDESQAEARADIHKSNGKALGTLWAAMCVDDMMRTKRFIHGIYKAMQDVVQQKKSPIHILYAGTGPFATLLLPNMLRFPKEQIQYTFMEINPISMNSVQELLTKLDMEDYSIRFLQEDASTYQIPEATHYDIIISETLQAGLAKEQQVAIFLNLMHQSAEKTIFIPEAIELHLAARKHGIPAEKLRIQDYQLMAKVFEVSKTGLAQQLQSCSPYAFDKVQTQATVQAPVSLFLVTRLQVYQDETLELNNSSLTIPLYLGELSASSGAIHTQYIMDEQPRLEVEIQKKSNT